MVSARGFYGSLVTNNYFLHGVNDIHYDYSLSFPVAWLLISGSLLTGFLVTKSLITK